MKNRWQRPGGYKEALNIGLPLVASMASTTLMIFTDRIFLGHYAVEALAAALPASVAAFLFYSFFLGMMEYVGVFVAQYTGACKNDRVGSALWVGLWFVVPSGLFLAWLGTISDWIFTVGGHPAHLIALESEYFATISYGQWIGLASVALSTFYSGRGITKPVMIINMIAAAVNIPLDYALINGYWGFPELGIRGAAIATVTAYTVNTLLFGIIVFSRKNQERFQVRTNWRLDFDLMRRFLRYALPGGTQFFMDMFAVSFFVFMVGRVGQVELAATNIAISIDTVSFLPTVGMAIAASIMVGQSMGAGLHDQADYSTKSVLHISVAYMLAMGVLFVVFPEFLTDLFRTKGLTDAEFAPVRELSIVLLRYVAAFTIVDAFAITYSGALKGAGDTMFVMIAMGIIALFVVVIPVSIMFYTNTMGVHGPWICLLLYVIALGTAFKMRFDSGCWKKHRIIES